MTLGEGYLLFCGRTRKMTQYAATAVADIDPGNARFVSLLNLGKNKVHFYALQPRARVKERSS